MTTATLDTSKIYDFDAVDLEYLRHGGTSLLARIYRPRGEGPFPALVECHGGAWCQSDRLTESVRHQAMASHGIVSIALDFRSGSTDPYPASVQDINFAVRWAKRNARDLMTEPELVGLSGQSSGGHLAMLVAMRPHDVRYAAIPLDGGHDASARCVVMSWPVINPLSRYRLAKRVAASADPPAWPSGIMARQDVYWRSEAAMEEGNPLLALERGEKVLTPPAIWFQGTNDVLHDYHDAESDFPGHEPQRFVELYRKAGGEITLTYVEAAERHTGHAPNLAGMGGMFEEMAAFVHGHIAV
jgi:acetyl esterase